MAIIIIKNVKKGDNMKIRQYNIDYYEINKTNDEFYSFEKIEQDMDDDIITSAEEGFMRGYLSS
jgi:hypothetical protein